MFFEFMGQMYCVMGMLANAIMQAIGGGVSCTPRPKKVTAGDAYICGQKPDYL
jgi:hypothetical protein